MLDVNTKIKNRVHKTYDLEKLWGKLRKEGMQVYEAEDYENRVQAPYHLIIIDKGYGATIEVMYRDKTEDEIAWDKQEHLTPFKQEIQWVRY